MSLPGTHHFELYQGDTDRLSYTFLEDDAARTPVDLTGSVVRLTARHNYRDTTGVIELDAKFDNPLTGDFHFDILPATTKDIGQLNLPLDLVYDMQYTHGTTVITIVTGTLTIRPEVTR